MSEEDKGQMSFWEHLDDLRKVLFRMVVVFVIAAVAMFVIMPDIFDAVILAPCRGSFPTYRLFNYFTPDTVPADFTVSLMNIQLASQLFVHMTASGYGALLVTFPVLIYLLYGFVAPALYKNEKKYTRAAFLFGTGMFYIGILLGYFLVFPITLRFLATYQLSDLIPNTITLDSYMDNFTMICLIMGAMFELPLLAWILGKFGLLSRKLFFTYRRHAIVALLIVAALITPTGDPFTLMIVFIPIYILYEISAWLVPANKEQ